MSSRELANPGECSVIITFIIKSLIPSSSLMVIVRPPFIKTFLLIESFFYIVGLKDKVITHNSCSLALGYISFDFLYELKRTWHVLL